MIPQDNGQPVDELPILAGLTHISMAQQQVVDNLWKMVGHCGGCRKIIRPQDAKLVAGTINSSNCAIEKFRNTVGIIVYCADCAGAIDALLKNLRPQIKPALVDVS